MKLKSDRKIYMIIGLCAILLVMSIGYAAFSSLLTINGTASLTDSFCVGFDNTKLNTYVPTAGISGGTLPTGSMSYSGTACSTNYQPNSSLSATFKQPGDKIEYTLTIANKSTFTVAIESILVENQSVTSNTTITKGNIKYMVEMPLTTTLASNAETTMKITAMFQNDTDVTGNYTGESQTINVKINAEQGDSGFTPTPATFTGAIYRYTTDSSKSLALPGSFAENIGGYSSTIENLVAGTDYTLDPATLNKTYYLKNDIVNNVVSANYVCIVFNNTEHCLRGGDGEASLEDNTEVIREFQDYYNLPTFPSVGSYEVGCSYENNLARCKNSEGITIYIAPSTTNVDVFIEQNNIRCAADCYGTSYCKDKN